MKTDIEGKLRNTRLATTRPLLPVFEAIINGIHAIDEAGTDDSVTEIRLLREPVQQTSMLADAAEPPIAGFIVEDNGVGFTDKNFDSFNNSESTYKAQRGGKGIGRFLWLKAFSDVRVRSVYKGDGKWMERSFRFQSAGEGITDAVARTARGATANRTAIELI